ncbi:acetyl-CoA carboxylase biotin carboxyl carrier protein [Enterococcus hirae]|uniref:acetyl-CoA carboxylase biotin carboxyl carrier protein n=1 Tax=Enterococcus hirae TaxID=1354 RepID=UPI00032DE775|nr:acetyl-CoA carboxylase biotin carboxyl carrier protein [Enterococcus hirae]EOF58146.1 acetyl-CoA carboxylase, biotin carboxyl carrier protein [Enterococcus hirae EnGen0127]MCV3103139.1 acetyl-CoA carboxylase biotin carboxyl carrier protein [Enterococcus hirae]MCV3107517.1 acetyl-CoA carboxylase biotin carboxyl carrier protein [Enterococcus hirae]QXJ63723.1 acetyl-CoA carboxylase biotin carboxyl carrier protein [Enterococcus hirae]
MNINEIKELVSQFDQSTLTEFDLREGQFELYMNKNESSRGMGTMAPMPVATEAPRDTVVPQTPIQQTPVSEAPQASVEASQESFEGVEVKSPIVGIVYLQPAPDKPQFKSVGDSVKKGEVICIIEAMKLMNEIASEVDGKIVEILVENEAVVEYDQPLFRIQPN